MIIKQLKIDGYGKWLDTQINFKDSLETVYGPNEAGKSTIIDFIVSMLFGFQTKRQAIHGQYIPKNHQSKYGGEIIFEHQGHQYRLIRTKGPKGGTVKFFDEDHHQQLSESDYQQLISPLDRDTYQQLFYFNGEDQRAAYQMSEDELRLRIQQVGVANADQWFDLQKELNKQAKALYTVRGRKPELNAQLHQYQTLMERLQTAEKDYPKYQALKKSRDALDRQLTTAQANREQLQKRLQENQKRATIVPLLTTYRELAATNETQLKKGFANADESAFQMLNSRILSLQDQLKTAQRQLEDQKSKIGQSPFQTFYNQHRSQIDSLKARLPKIKDQLPQFRFLTNQTAEIQQQLTTYRDDIPKNGNGELPLPFEETDLMTVTEILNQSSVTSRQTRRQQPSSANHLGQGRLFYGLAGVLVLLTLVLHHLPLSWLGYLAAGWLAWYGFRQQTSVSEVKTEASNQSDREATTLLADLADKYHLIGIPHEKWLSIQPKLKQLVVLADQASRLTSQKDRIEKGLVEYVEKWRFASEWLPLTADVMANIELIDQTLTKWLNQANDYHNQTAGLTFYQQSVDQLEGQLRAEQAKLAEFLEERHVTSGDGFTEMRQQQQVIQAKLTRKKEILTQLNSVGVSPDQPAISGLVSDQEHQITAQLTQIQTKINQLTRQKTELTVQITDLVNNGRYDDLKQTLANQKSEILDNVHRYLALLLSLRWVQRVLDIATKDRLPKAIKTAKKYFKILTRQRYQDIQFGDQISVIRMDGERFLVNELSKGTLEQLYLSLIFSIAVGFSDDYPMPIIIDDGFMSFDEQRRQAAFEIMTEISQQTQVLYFSAHQDLPKAAKIVDLTQI